jgi:DNA-binding NarL/FixJ family response regulator
MESIKELTPKELRDLHYIFQLNKNQEKKRGRGDISGRPLSKTEVIIAELISKGMTNKVMGNYLGISEQTIKNHVSTIMEKTKTKNRVQIALTMINTEHYIRYKDNQHYCPYCGKELILNMRKV